jgi:hypothetical protein
MNFRLVLSVLLIVCLLSQISEATNIPHHHTQAHLSDTVAGNILAGPIAVASLLFVGLAAVLF